MSDQKFLTAQQVADALQISKMTVTRMIRRGDIQAYKVGNQYRIPHENLQTYMAKADTSANFDEDYIAPDGGGITFTKQSKNDKQ